MAGPIQLFDTLGNLAATVLIPWDAEIVLWGHKYYALRDGRYVECKCVAGYTENQKPTSLVGFNISRR